MIRNFVYLVLGSMLLTGCVAVQGNKHIEEHEGMEKPAQVLRHVVLLKFKDGATPAEIQKVESAFAALPSKVDAIYDLEWGTDVSVENLQQGFTHCFIVSFLSEADRAKYLPHPAHKEFGQLLGPHLDKALVVDFWTKN
jgi:hypothetical protein